MKVTSITLLALAGILGCSTPPPGESRNAAATVQTIEPSPAPALNLALAPEIRPYLEPPSEEGLPEVFKGKPCQLGKSCLAMDPRPFEVCLLGTTKRCGDKMVETMRVDNPDGDAR